ncbi:Auxin efflux carrier family protein isoform 1 [Hibiscus syriacus]|uniref:Auxin efflux carrier family protein isoform 1 n=1 Tax=Hibiscus syriacus TaxID=106335 RepID=A0A6A3BCV3_HIBSY|nr:Auxin efflux carrier family protein isoform 1 [Hibiscus syriacus]
MGLIDLLIVALIPVTKVLLVTGVGLFLALDHVNLLGPDAKNHLNKLVFYVFGPSLVAINLAGTITFDSFLTLWFMPVNILITFIIGSALAWILIKITKTPRHLQGMVIGCCSAGNLGNLPLILVPAVCEEPNNPFGDSSTCSANAGAYASLSLAVGAIFIWSYAYGIMRSYANICKEDSLTITIQTSEETSEAVLESCREALLISKDRLASDEYSIQELPLHNFGTQKEISVLKKGFQCINRIMKKINLKEVLAPSAIAGVCQNSCILYIESIVGFIVGTVSPIRQLLIGADAPLRVIECSINLIGYVCPLRHSFPTSHILNFTNPCACREPTVACMTLLVGANLLKGLKGSDMSPSIIVGIIAVRNILMPLFGVGVVRAAQHFGVVGSDPLFQFVLMLQYALPPAMAVGTMTQLFQVGQSESSVIMLWTYAVAAFSITIWSTVFMWLLV